MARSLKPQKMKTVWDHTNTVSLDIMLDRENMVFFFDVLGEQTFDPSGLGNHKYGYESAHTAEQEARAKLKEITGREWEAIIEVNHEATSSKIGNGGYVYGSRGPYVERDDAVGLKVQFRRLERGRVKGTEKWTLERRHPLDVPEGEDAPPEERSHGSYGEAIPYSDESWRSLTAIVRTIHEVNRKLATLVVSPALLSRLFTMRGLPALAILASSNTEEGTVE